MSKYIENNLNAGEHIEIEIIPSKLVIVQQIIAFVIYLGIAIVLHIFGNKLVDWINRLITETVKDNVNDLCLFIKITVFVLIWGAFAFFGVFVRVATIIDVYSTKLAITNRRIIGKRGVFRTHSLDYPLEKIDNVTVDIPLFGKIFHCSTIKIKSTNDGGLEFEGVSNANEFRNALTEAIAKNEENARKAQADEIANAMKAK